MMTICFIRNVICARNLAENNPRFRPSKDINETDVYFLYDELRENCFPDFPKFEPGFSFTQIDQPCHFLKIIAFIYEWDVDITGKKGKADGSMWRSLQVEGNLCLNMLVYNGHVMYIKKLKALFKQFQCLKCKHCFC